MLRCEPCFIEAGMTIAMEKHPTLDVMICHTCGAEAPVPAEHETPKEEEIMDGETTTVKTCKKCGETKTANEENFFKVLGNRDGLDGTCRACRKALAAARWAGKKQAAGGAAPKPRAAKPAKAPGKALSKSEPREEMTIPEFSQALTELKEGMTQLQDLAGALGMDVILRRRQ